MKGYRLFAAAIAMAASCSMAFATTLCVNPDGTDGCYKTISAAVAAASVGDTVQVQDGTYYEQVTITKSGLFLVAAPSSHPVIDAMNKPVGVFVNGMSAAPGRGVFGVLISGFQIRNANFEGVLVANGNEVTISHNHIYHNNLSLDAENSTCPGIDAFETNEGFDCGEGVHLMSTISSLVTRNEIDQNAGGILLSDETGSTFQNVISHNFVHDNPFDCGITLASHGPAKSVIPTATLPFGIARNTISYNISARNGLALFGAGAGVGIFAPFPGTSNAGNVVIGNELIGNGLPGVAMHNHAAAPSPAPPVNLSQNSIINNHFSGNGADTEDTATSGTAGINIASKAPVEGTIITGNTFDDEQVDITFNAPTGLVGAHYNNFSKGTGVANLKGGTVDATENWWHCPFGPNMGHACATVSGPVWFAPWLTEPADSHSDSHSDRDADQH
ncbi:MAG TPA: right-handed parallel beta-helix repeat-containing protein [Acidobacteriaceae bacterium]|nr:right-handed parallel beta-helix repeat-containing protein [Acidobacteriaceae bacterium]